MNILSVLSDWVRPLTELADKLHTSDAERLELKNALGALHAAAGQQLLDYEARVAEARAKIVAAEVQGENLLQRAWRPITMLTFLVLTVCDAVGALPCRLAEQAWDLLQIGLGGYVIGRSAEKTAAVVARALSAGKDGA